MSRRRLCVNLASLLAAGHGATAWSQSEPPMTLIAPSTPGGGVDTMARLVAELLRPIVGRTIVVENKPGANGSIGYHQGAKAASDGSVLVLTSSAFTVNPATMKNLPYDTLKDFSAIGGLAQSPMVMVANTQFPAQTARELKALMQREPGRVSFATGDSSSILGTETLFAALGARAPIVNYKGGSPALLDVAGRHVALNLSSLSTAMPLIKGGQVKPLGIMASSRLRQLPQIPTLAEQGVNVEFPLWWAVHANSRVPKATISKLGADLHRMVESPAFSTRIEDLYAAPFPLGPAELDAFVVKDVRRMAELAAIAGLKQE